MNKKVKVNLKISDRTVVFNRIIDSVDIELVPYQMNGKEFTVVCVGKLEDDSTIIDHCKDSHACEWFTSGHEDTPKFKDWEEVIAYASSPEDELCPHYLLVRES
tara:strand:+ start:811 stop:1122 length:312 start_codon:yes stop_codon:yes gene_type:complete